MGEIQVKADEVYRDFTMDGSQASGRREPPKVEIRDLFKMVDAAVYAAQAGLTIVANTAARDAFFDIVENRGKLAYVNNNNGEPDDPANGVYEYAEGAARIAEGFYQGVANVVQPLVDSVVAAAAEIETTISGIRISTGDLLPAATPSPSLGGGAAATPGTQWGVTIPAGEDGSSQMQARYTLPYAPQDGDKAQFDVQIETSATFTRTMFADLVVATAANPFGVLRAVGLTVTPRIDGTSRSYLYEYEFQGDELGFWPRIQTVDAGDAATEEQWEVVGLTESRTFAVGNRGTAADEMLASRVPFIMGPIVQPMRLGSGNILDTLEPFRALNGGAAATENPFELAIPATTNGNGAQVQARWTVSGAGLADKRVEITVVVQPNAAFNRAWSPLMLIVSPDHPTGEFRPDRLTQKVRFAGTALVYTFTYHFEGDETGLWFAALINDATVAVAEERIAVTGFAWTLIDAPSVTASAADLILDTRLTAALAGAGRHAVTVEVRAAGEVPHVEDAIAAIVDASAVHKYRVRFAGAIEGVAELHTKDHVDIVGANRDAIYRFANPDDATAAEIEFSSLLWTDSQSTIAYGEYEVTNARYVFHPETAGSGIRNRTVTLFNVRARHRGNAAAVNNTWSPQSQVPVGFGLSSGCQLIVDASELIGPGGAFGGHNNPNADTPVLVDIRDTLIASTVPGLAAMRFAPCGSKQPDLIRLVGNSWCGDFVYGTGHGSPWLLTGLADQPAWQNEAEVIGHGNSGLLFRAEGTGVALKIESASTGVGSTVEIDPADALWPLILGDGTEPKHERVAGHPGLAGFVLGWGNISGEGVGFSLVDVNSLAQRLGDRSGAAVEGKVKVDGGSWQTVTMNANYRGALTASIAGNTLTVTAHAGAPLAIGQKVTGAGVAPGTVITALGSGAGATGTYTVSIAQAVSSRAMISLITNAAIVALIDAQVAGADVSAYPIDRDFMARLTDEEWVVRNDTATGIRPRTIVAWDTIKGQNVRPMTAADPVSRIAGVLLERLPPGEIARVKKPGGLLMLDWVQRTDAAAVTIGDGFSISADGKVEKSEAKPVLRAIRGDAFEILG